MRRENRQPTRREWAAITSNGKAAPVERERTERRRKRLMQEEMERQADPFAFGTEYPKSATGRTFSTPRQPLRARREPERSQWEWENRWT